MAIHWEKLRFFKERRWDYSILTPSSVQILPIPCWLFWCPHFNATSRGFAPPGREEKVRERLHPADGMSLDRINGLVMSSHLWGVPYYHTCESQGGAN